VTEPEPGGADTADPLTKTLPERNGAPAKGSWWKKPTGAPGAALAAAVVAVIAVAGYLGVRALQSPTSPQSTSPSTPGIFNHDPGLPPGADRCGRIYASLPGPFNAGARGTPATSCAFVEEVRKEYSAHGSPEAGPVQLSVVSPSTSRWYKLACLSSPTYVTCTGGAAAVIYLYNRTGPE
jgi:hypothetical protein